MSLKERITEDMKSAMRAKDADRLLAIRGLLAALKQREVDERIVLDDAAVVAIVDKLVKQRKDSITAFTQGGRADLVDRLAVDFITDAKGQLQHATTARLWQTVEATACPAERPEMVGESRKGVQLPHCLVWVGSAKDG